MSLKPGRTAVTLARVATVMQLLLLVVPYSCGRELIWRQCNGCGRNTPQESRGCDLEYDLAPPEGSARNIERQRTAVYPGERIEIPVKRLMNTLISDDWFVNPLGQQFKWKENGILYYTLSVLRPTNSTIIGPVDRFMIYQEIKDSEIDNGYIHSFIPALEYSNELLGGSATTLQISVNANPGNLFGTFPVNYYSLEDDNRAYLCADIEVNSSHRAWENSDFYQWKTGSWSACVHQASQGICPYESEVDSGIQQRDVYCHHPAVILGSEDFVQGMDGIKQDPRKVVPESKCVGEEKPASSRSCMPPPCSGGPWSTWSSSLRLSDGDSVEVPTGLSGEIILDQSPPKLNALIIKSTVRVDDQRDKAIEIYADSVIVDGGSLIAGSAQSQWSGKKFDIYLTSSYTPIYSRSVDSGARARGGHTKALVVMNGGKLLLYGAEGASYSKLVKSARAGSSSVTISGTKPNWNVGDWVVIASSDFHDILESEEYNRLSIGPLDVLPSSPMSERRRIAAINSLPNGVDITLNEPLKHSHFGSEGPDKIAGRLVDMRSEVVWLSRNIQVQGSLPRCVSDLSGYPKFENLIDLYSQSGVDPVFGGHFISLPSVDQVEIQNVEFGPHLGQAGRMARYPVHFHKLKSKGSNCFVSNCSVHDSYQRAITIHDTEKFRLHHSSSYNVRGHAMFWEDGTEVENEVVGNIAIGTRPQLVQDLRADVHDDLPSGFWITNFNNKFEDNIAADTSRGVGFWFKVVSHSEGELLSHPQAVASSLGKFRKNVAHSNHFAGLWIWHDWYPCAPVLNTYHYYSDGPDHFSVFGSSSVDLRFDSDVEFESGNPAGIFGNVRRNGKTFGGSSCRDQPEQVLSDMLTFKHRDIGTAAYLTSTNIRFKDFISVSDTVAMSFAQIYRDQTGFEGLSMFDRQKISGLLVATSAAHGNTLNRDKWCYEMASKGVPDLEPSACPSECHPWPETAHPSGFPERIVLSTSEQRYLSGVTLSNEGQVGAQEIEGLTLVDWGPSPACGVIDTKGVHVKPGIGIEFPSGSRRVDSVKVIQNGQDVTSTTPLGWIIRLHANENYGNHETIFLQPEALGSMRTTFPSGAFAMVPSGDDDLFILDDVSGPNGNGCIDQRVEDSIQSKESDSVLCDARDLWMTTMAVDFSNTDLYLSGNGPGELTCTPSVLLLDYGKKGEFERTYAGVGWMEDGGIGRPTESNDFYRYRYPFKVAVGKMYLVDFGIDALEDCAALYATRNQPTFLTMEKMDYNASKDGERAVDLVLSFPTAMNLSPDIRWYVDTTDGDYGKLGSETTIYVPLPSKKNLQYIAQGASDLVYGRECCDDKIFIHVRLGQRIEAKDTAIELRFSESEANEDCSAPCDSSPWPWGSSFVDTSAQKARGRYEA